MSHVTVIGAGYAGLIALGRLRQQLPDATLTLVEPRDAFEPRIELHRVAAGAAARVVPLGPLCTRLHVEHRRTRLERVDGRTLILSDGSLTPDATLLAVGSRTRTPPGPATRLDSVADAQQLAATLADRPTARVTVIGGGTTGLEVATSLKTARPTLRVTLWRRSTPGMSEAALTAIEARLRQLHIPIVEGPVLGIDATHAWGDALDHPHDLAVWCAGFTPVQIEGTGPYAPDGRLAVDAFLRVREGLYAAGDSAVPPTPHRLGCVSAMPMGAHAAGNIARQIRGEPLEVFGFRDWLTCVDLAAGHGLVQSLDADGHPGTTVVGGRMGGLMKRGIFGWVRGMLALERTLGLPVYNGSKGDAAALLEAS